MKIEDILEEKHLRIYEQIVSYIEKSIQRGENLTPFMGVLTKNSDFVNTIPFPPEMLNNGENKAILDSLIRKFIEYLQEKYSLGSIAYRTWERDYPELVF